MVSIKKCQRFEGSPLQRWNMFVQTKETKQGYYTWNHHNFSATFEYLCFWSTAIINIPPFQCCDRDINNSN